MSSGGADEVGCSLIGQTADIAPADKKLYALRDVTGTVESIPLISASIMSKKIAEGIGALVLDVKAGRGAFMKTGEGAPSSPSPGGTATRNGVRTEALITAMDAPLGRAVGNALEVIEAIETLKGRGPKDLEELSVRLASRMLVLAGVATTMRATPSEGAEAIASGAGVERFREIIEWQGGDPRVIDDYSRLPGARQRHTWRRRALGSSRLDAGLVGRAAMALGAGTRPSRCDDGSRVGGMLQAVRGRHVRRGRSRFERPVTMTHRCAAALALDRRGRGDRRSADGATSVFSTKCVRHGE